jgi:hypothetical protein
MTRRSILLLWVAASPTAHAYQSSPTAYQLDAEMRGNLTAFKDVWDSWTWELIEGRKKNRKLELLLRKRWEGVEKWLFKD